MKNKNKKNNIQISKLKNNLTVVTDRMDHIQTASLGVWVKAGSRDEKNNEHGIAHLIEHMAFKGTTTRSAQQIASQIENVGGDVNAATGAETTSYYARVLKDDVPLAVNILADILTDSLFEYDELKREQHVIVQEIGAAQDNPEDLVFENFQKTAFRNQALGRSILGTPKTVRSFTADNLRKYLKSHYRGPNMVLAAAGAVNHDQIVRLAEKQFSGFGKKKATKPTKSTYKGGEKKVSRKLMEAQILLGFEGRAYCAKDFYASQVLAMALGGGMSSRLFQEVREKLGLCYSIYSFHAAYSDTGIFGIHAATEKNNIKRLTQVVATELKKVTQKIDQQELDRARAQIKAGLLMSQENPTARARRIAQQILLFGRHITNEELEERFSKITTRRLKNIAQKTFTKKPTLAAIGPVQKLDSTQKITQMIMS